MTYKKKEDVEQIIKIQYTSQRRINRNIDEFAEENPEYRILNVAVSGSNFYVIWIKKAY